MRRRFAGKLPAHCVSVSILYSYFSLYTYIMTLREWAFDFRLHRFLLTSAISLDIEIQRNPLRLEVCLHKNVI